jgi:hypothetical protein
MRPRRRPVLGNERGQVMIVTAIAFIALFGFTALTIDVGRMYFERRQLQRTADLSAYSATQTLGNYGSASATADAIAIANPTNYRAGKISPTASSPCDYLYVYDFNDAGPPTYSPPGSPCANPTPSNPCIIASVPYYCVHTQAASKNFKFLFAPILGIGANRTVTASATAIVGASTPHSDRLVPWIITDCPYPYRYPDEANMPAAQYPSGCTDNGTVSTPGTGYPIATAFTDPATTLFLGNSGGASGNFLGADLDTSSCRGVDQGTSGAGGANDYNAVLNKTKLACPIAKGARVVPETGSLGANTLTSLATRGVNTWDAGSPCTTLHAFNRTIAPVGGNQVQILDRTNPCLMGIAMVVQINPGDSRMTKTNWNFQGTNCNYPAANPVTVDAMTCIGQVQDPVVSSRFGPPGAGNHGASDYLLVRRFSLFYLTQTPTNPANCANPATCGYKGLFLRAVDSIEGTINGPADQRDGVQITKLVG